MISHFKLAQVRICLSLLKLQKEFKYVLHAIMDKFFQKPVTKGRSYTNILYEVSIHKEVHLQ